jgi:hypothetical protein
LPVLRVDAGCKTHEVGIAGLEGTILEEFATIRRASESCSTGLNDVVVP